MSVGRSAHIPSSVTGLAGWVGATSAGVAEVWFGGVGRASAGDEFGWVAAIGAGVFTMVWLVVLCFLSACEAFIKPVVPE